MQFQRDDFFSLWRHFFFCVNYDVISRRIIENALKSTRTPQLYCLFINLACLFEKDWGLVIMDSDWPKTKNNGPRKVAHSLYMYIRKCPIPYFFFNFELTHIYFNHFNQGSTTLCLHSFQNLKLIPKMRN